MALSFPRFLCIMDDHTKGSDTMQQIPVSIDPNLFPESLQEFLVNTPVFDSSCSPEARVYYLNKDGGYYLKTAPRGTLDAEAAMTRYFHRKGLSAEVLAYESTDRDFLLTRAVPGKDCLDRQYLEDPKKLSETLGILLRQLHDTDPIGCPVQNRTALYLADISRNHQTGCFDLSLFPGTPPFSGPEEAWQMVQQYSGQLKQDTLLHGDFCLPNVILQNWNFSAFIDVGGGGIGDRHMDLFWGAWSLAFNLKTDWWCGRFLDAYGRDKADPDLIRTVAACECFR